MSAEVVPLHPGLVGDGFEVLPDDVLEQAKGRLACVVVVGQTTGGEQFVAGSHGAPDTVFQMELAKRWLLNHETLRS